MFQTLSRNVLQMVGWLAALYLPPAPQQHHTHSVAYTRLHCHLPGLSNHIQCQHLSADRVCMRFSAAAYFYSEKPNMPASLPTLFLSLASSHPSSQGTVNSVTMICLNRIDHTSMSGRRNLWNASGNNLFPKSNLITHVWAMSKWIFLLSVVMFSFLLPLKPEKIMAYRSLAVSSCISPPRKRLQVLGAPASACTFPCIILIIYSGPQLCQGQPLAG